MLVAAQGARADAGLAVRFTVSSRGLGIPVERLGRCAGAVVDPAVRGRVFVPGPVRLAGMSGVFTAVAGHSALHVRCYAPLASSSVVIVSVVKRGCPGVVPVVVINYVSVMPVESPMTPAPSKTAEETDSEADSEREVRATKPDSGIRVPVRPRGDWVSVHHPRVVGGNVNDFGVGRLNDDRRTLRRYGLLRRGLQVAGCLRPLAHHLYGIHYILLLVVVGVA